MEEVKAKTKTELHQKLENLQRREFEVLKDKKDMAADYRDQIREVRDELKEVLAQIDELDE